MNKNKTAFTLVELIVVITILAILGTIAFISLQGYSKDTRNSVRLSDLSNINKTLGIQMVTAGKVQIPDNYVEITASGTVLNYQGESGEKVLETLGVFNGGKDPKDDTYYTYSTNTNRTKYQLLGFLEGDAIASTSLLENTYAVTDLSERAIVVKGDDVGILLDSIINIPVTTTVDVVNTVDTYKITFTDENLIEGTGGILFSNIYNRNEALLDNKEFASLDDSLVGYWDMETLTGGLLKDFSSNNNDISCYNNGLISNCDDNNGPKIVEGLKGKGIQILGEKMNEVGDYLWQENLNGDFDNFDNITINLNFKIIGEKQFFLENSLTDYFLISRDTRNDSLLNRCNVMFINGPERGASHLKAGGFWASKSDNCINQTIDSNFGSFINEKINLNDWSNMVLTINNGIIRLYYNGNKVRESIYSGTLGIYNYPLIFGNGPHMYQNLNGVMDEVRIYKRALSENEIQTLYNSTK